MIEMKMALIKLLRQFEIHATTKTPQKLTYIEGIVRSACEPIIVQFKKRHF